MNKVEAFLAAAHPAGPEPLTVVQAAPVVGCTVDVAEGAALGFVWIARAAQRAHAAGRAVATATRDIGFHPGSSAPAAGGAGAHGAGLPAHQLIDLLAGLS
ncbi:hypothetical protein SAMN04489727_4021 [Amycolatopsis tolypomycina]|uniref:Uncharacterized protein n=1 Tax=Amycolatopsis tolypomycina TaxID=208445 RepID=A0A1H4T4C5_9PSEU|nr:hypothetical protein [Amycolatopsis tolypomycina]SEC51139.1 hypothetical protein SAMN04489727_4021 [Amycolatopsis tolypomycina]